MLTCDAATDRDSLLSEDRPHCALAQMWARLVRGHAKIGFVRASADRITLAARATPLGVPLSERDAAMLTRALCGDAQKNIAPDFNVTVSTVSTRCAWARNRLTASPGKIALPLVLAAQSFAGLVSIPSAQRSIFGEHETSDWIVEIARPQTDRLARLSPAEREVAHQVIEGRSRVEIAIARGTSAPTVGVQMRAMFAALGVRGRPDLIRRAAELGCFDG